MFGGGNKTPQPKQRPLGIDEVKASTSEEARPVIWFAGKQRFGVTFITDVFQQKAVSVTQTVGKQKSKVGYNYFASFAFCACHGPVDGLFDIFLNGDSVYASDVKLSAISLTSAVGVATFSTKNAHGVIAGQGVIIEGANEGDYNGSAVVLTVPTPSSFTYAVLGSPAATATGKITAKVKLDPVLRDVDNPDYVDILIPDYGMMRLYWGTEAQGYDPLLATSGVDHPPYKGICYGVCDTLFLGFNQTNVPNIELVLLRKPVATWHDIDLVDSEANPFTAICDFIQNPRAGYGIADARIDTADVIASAEAVEAENIGLSPFFNRQQEARQSILQILEHVDGYPLCGDDGKLTLRLARKPVGAVVTITDDDIAEFVKLSPESWLNTFSETELKCVNRDKAFKEDALTYREPFVLAINGEPTKATMERPFVTQRRIAEAFVKSAGRSNALPNITGSVPIRKHGTLYDDLAPGSLFKFSLSTRDLSRKVFRVVDRGLPESSSMEFDITFRLDKSYLYESPEAP